MGVKTWKQLNSFQLNTWPILSFSCLLGPYSRFHIFCYFNHIFELFNELNFVHSFSSIFKLPIKTGLARQRWRYSRLFETVVIYLNTCKFDENYTIMFRGDCFEETLENLQKFRNTLNLSFKDLFHTSLLSIRIFQSWSNEFRSNKTLKSK